MDKPAIQQKYSCPILQSNRLLLRQWTDSDLVPFAALNADPDVMAYFPAMLSSTESDRFAASIRSLIQQRGWGLWAVEVTGQAAFIGFVGLHMPTNNLPCSPCVEIGWRLAKAHWGKGYASEAAKVALAYAFEELELAEVLSFTATANQRSEPVMKKIGMLNTGKNFKHPDINAEHPLCEHLLYKITAQEWRQRRNTGVPPKSENGSEQLQYYSC